MSLTLDQMAQAIDLNQQVDSLNSATNLLNAMAAASTSNVVVTFSCSAWAAPDGTKVFAGVRTQVSVPVATAQQIVAAELKAAQSQLNTLMAAS